MEAPARLEPRPPFGVLVVSELSRIGGDSGRTHAAMFQLERVGVDIRSYLTGTPITLGDESGEIMTVIHALTTFERRRARRVFGYLNHLNGDGYVHRVIDEGEARPAPGAASS